MLGAEFESTLARAQDGDEVAFARIFRDVQPALLLTRWARQAKTSQALALRHGSLRGGEFFGTHLT